MKLEIKTRDFLTDNAHVYAIKAKRKKISILEITASNRTSADVRLQLGLSKLNAHGNTFDVEQPEAVIRRLQEFTWDFLLYSIIDFHPVTAMVGATLFLIGPIYNRRLRRQLASLSADELLVPFGEFRSALVAFPRNLIDGQSRCAIPMVPTQWSIAKFRRPRPRTIKRDTMAQQSMQPEPRAARFPMSMMTCRGPTCHYNSHMNQHPPDINIADLEMERLVESESQGIIGPEEALHGWLADGVNELIDCRDGQDRGELGLFGNAQLVEGGPVSRASAGVKELQTGVGDFEGIAFPWARRRRL